jgi:hypothetical protein
VGELSREERAAMRELAAKATPGPWEACIGSGEHVCTALHTYAAKNKHGEHPIIADFAPDYLLKENLATDDHLPDLGFVEAAHPFVPKALDALDAADATCAAYRSVLEKAVLAHDAHSETSPGEDWRAWLDTATQLSDACTEGRILLASPDPARDVVERLRVGRELADVARVPCPNDCRGGYVWTDDPAKQRCPDGLGVCPRLEAIAEKARAYDKAVRP